MVSGSNGSKEEVDPPPENGDAAAQAVPDDDDSDVYVGNEITSFCLVVSREIVEYGPPNEYDWRSRKDGILCSLVDVQ